MQRIITGRYESREAAESARSALISIGVPADKVTIREPVQEAGIFDRLASMLAPRHAGDTEGGTYQLAAEVPPQRADQARLVLGQAATCEAAAPGLREQIFDFPEMREELRVEKQLVAAEEVVVRKERHEQVAEIEGTLRHTEVEVDQIEAAEVARPEEPPQESEPLRFGLKTRPE